MRTSSYNILVNVDSKLKLFAILNGYTRALVSVFRISKQPKITRNIQA